MSKEREVTIRVGETTGEVSGLLIVPDDARAALVFGHGAGAGMRHPFMARTARDLADAGVATLRFQFPYMEAGARRVDPQPVAEATVRAAIDFARNELAGLPLFAGGKSYGGRMTSNALAKQHEADVRGIIFYGFPLHMPRKPAVERAAHLREVRVPLLFLQGTRDELADLSLIRGVIDGLDRATLQVVEHGDHSFSVLKRSGRTAQSVHEELRDVVLAWMEGLDP